MAPLRQSLLRLSAYGPPRPLAARCLPFIPGTLLPLSLTSSPALPYQQVVVRPFVSKVEEPFWNNEWKKAQLKATEAAAGDKMRTVLFIECGMGCDQHGQRSQLGATKAAVRACRNAIEFNSIPSVEHLVPGGRPAMKIQLRLGVPTEAGGVDLEQVRAVFPYGKMLPIEVVVGGLTFQSGRVVTALGDESDLAVVVLACVTIGY